MESEVTQTPRHLIKTRGQKATLRCSPVSGHLSVYWYQQVLGQGPQFLIQYYDMKERDKGKIPERFSAQQFSDYSSQLDMTLLEPGDSALYLCASSLAQPCSISSLLYKNLPPPPPPQLRKRWRGWHGQLRWPGPWESRRASPRRSFCCLRVWRVLVLAEIMQDKYHVTCLHI